MTKKLLSMLVASIFGPRVINRGRARTCDVGEMAFGFRMPAGFAGDVNRTHPASILPILIDVDDPATQYGQPLIVDTVTNALRAFRAGDTAITDSYGFLVRPYPVQQTSGGMAATFGNATPPTSGNGDAMTSGYIWSKVPSDAAVATKGGAVFVWCAVSSGNHVQGGLETEASGGNTAALDVKKFQYNGPQDPNGVIEVKVII